MHKLKMIGRLEQVNVNEGLPEWKGPPQNNYGKCKNNGDLKECK